MDVDRFTRERAAGWEELAGLVQEAGTRPQRLGAEPLLRLGRRYRAAAADLALARRLFPGDPLTGRLERLVTDARQCVYASEARRRSVIEFITTGYWQRVRERPVPLLIALALMWIPIVLSAAWAMDDPVAALGVVPASSRTRPIRARASGTCRRTRRPRSRARCSRTTSRSRSS
jgi:hypothetical protein